jgi:anthranilate phosphoribosyltransferase
MRSVLQRIATGPEMSQDISREEARLAMRAILEGEVDPVQSGVFLIALRMKRETDEENLGVLEALREASETARAEVETLIDIADPYDGYTRTLPPSPFLPALLAACGVPALSHGVERVAPKFGLTHRQVLRAAGQPVDLSAAEAAARLADPAIGWAYVDQSRYCPRLHALIGLRELIVKRPVLTTVEPLIGPVRARRETHLLTGYVHKAYPRIYTTLARHAGFDSALVVRGVEGGVIPALHKSARCVSFRAGGEDRSLEIDPSELGIAAAQERPRAGDALLAVEAGLAALAGEPGNVLEGLVFAAALSLFHLGRHGSPGAAALAVREVVASGRALAHFRRGAGA